MDEETKNRCHHAHVQALCNGVTYRVCCVDCGKDEWTTACPDPASHVAIGMEPEVQDDSWAI